VLVLHGGRDAVVPQRFGRALLAAARPPKEGVFIEDADHTNAFAVGFPTFLEFMRQHLHVDGRTSGVAAPQPISSPLAGPSGLPENSYDDEAPQTA
jgi:fermentation-respiration switch protein FrsA (DUF1100 family)